MKRITVHDVAAEAGVSLATVDRVLNKRAGVRQATIDKVERAARKLNYKPDVYAANLAKRRMYRFCFVLPSSNNSFMQQIYNEVVISAHDQRQERTEVTIEQVDPLDNQALLQVLQQLALENYDGIAVVAPDAPMIRQAIDNLVAHGVQVVTLVSDLPSSNRSHFVGIDNIAAGRVAGRLLGRFLSNRPVKIGMVAGSMTLRDHVERRLGCEQIITSQFQNIQLLPVIEGHEDNEETREKTRALLEQHPDLEGIYSIGGANRGICEALEDTGRQHSVSVIAHELTDASRSALIDGRFDAIISQNPGHEIRSAIRVLKALVDGASINQSQEKIRIDIYMQDNLP